MTIEPDIDAIFITLPFIFLSTIIFPTALAIINCPIKFVSITCLNSSMEVSKVDLCIHIPALLKSISIEPESLRIFSKDLLTSFSFVTSHFMWQHFPPLSFINFIVCEASERDNMTISA